MFRLTKAFSWQGLLIGVVAPYVVVAILLATTAANLAIWYPNTWLVCVSLGLATWLGLVILGLVKYRTYAVWNLLGVPVFLFHANGLAQYVIQCKVLATCVS